MPQERVTWPFAEIVADLVALKASVTFDPGAMNLAGQGQGVKQAKENPDPDEGTLGMGGWLDRCGHGCLLRGLRLSFYALSP